MPAQPALDAMTRAGIAHPQPVSIVAMVDTGATGTVIKEGCAKLLKLPPVGKIRINTPASTGVLCFQYYVQLVFPNRISQTCLVTEVPLKDQSIHCLIGRDILKACVFVYTGQTNSFSLSF